MARQIEIITFGYGHGTPPPAHLTVDLRVHFRDPHRDPRFRQLTAEDKEVRDVVFKTSGMKTLLDGLLQAVHGYMAGPTAAKTPMVVAVGCAGGRHRAATMGMALADALAGSYPVTLSHRDMEKEVIRR